MNYYQQSGYANHYAYQDKDDTDPVMTSVLPSATGPLPPYVVMPQETRGKRFSRWLNHALETIVNKFSRLLALALTVVLLLLAGRFLLVLFALTHSLFSQWMFLITSPLMYPFANLAPTLRYSGYFIDVSTLVCMAVYIVTVIIVRTFLRILVTRE